MCSIVCHAYGSNQVCVHIGGADISSPERALINDFLQPQSRFFDSRAAQLLLTPGMLVCTLAVMTMAAAPDRLSRETRRKGDHGRRLIFMSKSA